MKKLSTDFIIISLAILFIFGSVFLVFSLEAWEEAPKIRQEQERMALYLINHYEGIEKIEFQDFYIDKMTGYLSSESVVNESCKVTFFVAGFEGDVSMDHDRNFTSQKLLAKQNRTLDSIEVSYYKEKLMTKFWKLFGTPILIFGIIFLVFGSMIWQRVRKSVKTRSG